MAQRRAAIYVRQSLDRSGEGEAVGRQLVACRELAAARGWQVVAEHVENDTSASGPRPVFDAMLADRASFDVLVAWHVDRVTRSMVDLERMVELGIPLVTVTGDVDLTTDAGRLVARILAAVARGEVERKGARQRAANEARSVAGAARWTRRPLGYRRAEDGSAELVPHEAEAIRDALRRLLAGETCRSIAKHMPPSTTGRVLQGSGVRAILLNPRYYGLSVHQGRVVGAGDWPAILPGADVERVRQLFAAPGRAVRAGRHYLLSGIALCGACGDPVFGAARRYRCKGGHVTRQHELLDQYVVDRVLSALAEDGHWLTAKRPDDAESAAELEEIETRRAGLAQLVAEGVMPAAVARTHLTELGARADELRAALAPEPAGTELGRHLAAGLRWETLSLAERRSVIRRTATVTIEVLGRGRQPQYGVGVRVEIFEF